MELMTTEPLGQQYINFNKYIRKNQYLLIFYQNLGGSITISFFAKWDSLDNSSRIIDFSNTLDNGVIYIANEGTTGNLKGGLATMSNKYNEFTLSNGKNH